MRRTDWNPPYSILSYSAGLRGYAMELSLLLPAVNGVLCRVAMSPAAGQGPFPSSSSPRSVKSRNWPSWFPPVQRAVA
jgi:hypothetical protein